MMKRKKWTCELIYLSLHLYYYALYGKLGEVRGSKLEILFKYDVVSVLDIMLNNEANEIKKAAAL
jgi:hypothetical protein